MSAYDDAISKVSFDQGESRLRATGEPRAGMASAETSRKEGTSQPRTVVRDRRAERAAAQRAAVAEDLAKFIVQTQTFKNATGVAGTQAQEQGKTRQPTIEQNVTSPPAIEPQKPVVPHAPDSFWYPKVPDKTKPHALVWDPDEDDGKGRAKWVELEEC